MRRFKGLSIKWKILAIAVAGPLLVASIMALQRVGDIGDGARESIVEKSRAVVLMAEAARKEMSAKLQKGVIRPFDEIPGDKVMEAVPVITAINMARSNAEKAGYDFRVPKVDPRNPDNTPTPEELEVLKELKAGDLDEKIVYEDDRIRYYRSIRLTPECLYCHGDPKGAPDAVGGVKEGWKAGEIHGAFEIISSLSEAKAAKARAAINVSVWTIGILAFILGAAWLTVKSGILRPLQNIQRFAGSVASGDLNAKAEGEYGAELSGMKGSIETMVDRLRSKMSEAESKSREAEEQAHKAEQAMQNAQDQEARVQKLLAKMTGIAEQAADIAEQVSLAADELAAQVEEVARGTEIQNERTSETATSMEEMNATVLEVAKNASSGSESAKSTKDRAESGAEIVEKSVAAIRRVYDKSQVLKEEMTTLGNRTDDISRVIDVISDIADQTNLLALNAAIEAARAGEAGRGFAVVADEVRKLAEKTMSATKEVEQSIHGIQQSARANIESVDEAAEAVNEATELAGQSGSALREILNYADETSMQVQSIATAAEEQSAASEEINRAIEDISRITQETSDGMGQSSQAVTELAALAQKLKGLIEEMTD
jgi:methyl-accepting chemotaxis protein